MRFQKTVTLATLTMLGACAGEWKTHGNIGGANQNIKAPGNTRGGIAIRQGDIAVAPSGTYFVTLRHGQLFMGDSQSQEVRPASNLPVPDKLAFRQDGDGFFILEKASGKVTAYDRATDKVLWTRAVSGQPTRLETSPDGSRVMTVGKTLELMDARDGRLVKSVTSTVGFRDATFSKDGQRITAAEETRWEGEGPKTTVSVRKSEDGAPQCQMDADNCSDDLVTNADETRVFLAPTMCQKDPVTVMSVEGSQCRVEKTLPGFGPVAASPDSKTMVAFVDRDTQGAPVDFPAEVRNSPTRYHLMFIDTATLKFTTQPIADDLPRFAFTPDGQHLLVDQPMDLGGQVQIVDLATKAARQVRGPNIKLNAFSLSPDCTRAFVVGSQLFELDIPAGNVVIREHGLPPDALNISPDGLTVFMNQLSDRALVFWDAVAGRSIHRTFY